mmetsp:Transcript_12913/g.33221  ORF Transcript_12913/g.33221 Transcript_12913/m.33221 type:complete len:201 (+) Transcript_12913:1119-1721(+)
MTRLGCLRNWSSSKSNVPMVVFMIMPLFTTSRRTIWSRSVSGNFSTQSSPSSQTGFRSLFFTEVFFFNLLRLAETYGSDLSPAMPVPTSFRSWQARTVMVSSPFSLMFGALPIVPITMLPVALPPIIVWLIMGLLIAAWLIIGFTPPAPGIIVVGPPLGGPPAPGIMVIGLPPCVCIGVWPPGWNKTSNSSSPPSSPWAA